MARSTTPAPARPIDDSAVDPLQENIGQAIGIRSAPRILDLAPRGNARRGRHPAARDHLAEGLMGEIGEDELRDVLLHEMAHVSRRDTSSSDAGGRGHLLANRDGARGLPELSRAREELCDNYVLQRRGCVELRRDALAPGRTVVEARPLARGGRHSALEGRAGAADRRNPGKKAEHDDAEHAGWHVSSHSTIPGRGVVTSATRFIVGSRGPARERPGCPGAREECDARDEAEADDAGPRSRAGWSADGRGQSAPVGLGQKAGARAT